MDLKLKEGIQSLIEFLSTFAQIPPAEILYFTSKLSFEKIKKDDYFFKQNEHFDKIGFVISGLLYNFYTRDSKAIHVNYFINEGMPATCYANLLTGTPAVFSCKALENTYLITIKYSDFKELYSRHPCWNLIGRLNAEKLYIEKEKREYEFLVLSSQEKYSNFIANHPKIINRVPQYLIASYVGVKPESLSRLRAQFLSKSKASTIASKNCHK